MGIRLIIVIVLLGLIDCANPPESHAQSGTTNGNGSTESMSEVKVSEDGYVKLFDGAPVCCIYVGLNMTNGPSFGTNVQLLAESHGIKRPRKIYTIYSGPPLSDYVNEHVAIESRGSYWTTNLTVAHTNICLPNEKFRQLYERIHFMIRDDCYWASKAGQIPEPISSSPFIGRVLILDHDPAYPNRSFKELSQSIIGELEKLYPGHVMVAWYEDK